MHLSSEQLLDIAGSAFVRLDGAWFLALAEHLGVEQAWRLDVEAWKRFSYVFAKRLRAEYIPDPIWPESFLDALAVFSRIMKIEGRTVTLEGDRIIIRVVDCETQKAIAKAGVADCGIATVATYQGLVRGLFNKEIAVSVRHTKNLNRGDDYCEVVIDREQAG